MGMVHIEEMLSDMDVLSFDGPPTAHVGGAHYIKLTSHGVQEEGAPLPSSIRFWSEPEAWRAYKAMLRSHLREGCQLAWRQRPHASVDGEGGHSIRSRLAVL